MTLASNAGNEKTQVFYGEEEATRILLQAMANVRKDAIVCSDKNSPAFSMGIESVKKGYIDFKKRGVRVRQIVEITGDNLDYCKEFMKYVELRHMNNIKGNMAINEIEYVATAVLEGAVPLTQTVHSNVQVFLEQQRYFFENLWNKAIPAEQRISELEQGMEPEFAEIITDSAKAVELIVDFAKSVRKSAQLILSQPSTITKVGRLGVWEYLIHAANNYGAQIQVISPITGENAEQVREVTTKAPAIRILAGPISGSSLFIQDEKRYFRAEDKVSEAEDASDAISRVIYSNTANGLKSFRAIFDTLWKQSELYEQLRLANEKLYERDQMQREFINIAAHELRTPIQPILSMTELWHLQVLDKTGKGERRAEEDEDKDIIEITRKELDIIIRNAKRLEHLSSNLLDVTRIGSGTFHLNVKEFNLNDALLLPSIHDSIQELKSKGLENDIQIRYTPPNHDVTVKGDKDRLSQVIWNLLNNAIKFTQKGAISIAVKKDDDHVTVTIKDSGKGIDSEILPRLFTKFVTKSETGTGLGLYISKTIVEAHGGKIWAQNNGNEKGATMAFMLPIENNK